MPFCSFFTHIFMICAIIARICVSEWEGKRLLLSPLGFTRAVRLPPLTLLISLAPPLPVAFLALASLTIWLYALVFALGFELTGPFVVMLLRMIKTDIARFGNERLLW